MRIPLQKMDLLKQITSRLPLDAFLRLGLSEGQNQLITRLGWYVPHRLEQYELSRALQGELSVSAKQFIPTTLLCSRAAFLRDARWYEYFITTSEKYPSPDTNLALISGVPEIQAWALAYNEKIIQPSDPASIDWTPGLISYFGENRSRLSGHLRSYLLPVSENGSCRLPGVVEREMKDRDPFQPVKIIDDLRRRIPDYEQPSLNKIYANGGYFVPLFNLQQSEIFSLATRYVQPELLARLPLMNHMPANVDEVITPPVMRRAKKMLPLIQRLYPNAIHYQIQLRVICGLPIDPDQIDSNIRDIMVAVAHPQMVFNESDQVYLYRSYDVYYDLNRFVDVERDFTFDVEKIHVLYAAGKAILNPVTRDVLNVVDESHPIDEDTHSRARKRFNYIMTFLRPK